jgi:hypothetical protein
MPVDIIEKPSGQLNLPGIKMDLYQIPEGAEIIQTVVTATMAADWRWSDTLTTMTGGPPCGMCGCVLTGALRLVTPDGVQTVNAGSCFLWHDDDLIDLFCAEPTICYDLSPNGLSRLLITTT